MTDTIVKEIDIDFLNKIAITFDKKSNVWRIIKIINKRLNYFGDYHFQRVVLSEHQNQEQVEEAFLCLVNKIKGKNKKNGRSINLFSQLLPTQKLNKVLQQSKDVLERNALAKLREESYN